MQPNVCFTITIIVLRSPQSAVRKREFSNYCPAIGYIVPFESGSRKLGTIPTAVFFPSLEDELISDPFAISQETP